MRVAAIPFGGRVYKVTPDMRVIYEIEEELGGLPALAARFRAGTWKISELVTLQHILLAAAGREVDYAALGAGILAEGAGRHARAALKILEGLTGADGGTVQERQRA